MHYLGLCCIVKNEAPFLAEWIAFHTLLGVESFIIYDNDSAIPVNETLQDIIAPNYVTVLRASGRGMQIRCYNHCLKEFGHNFFWLGFLDMDEFALPAKDGDLPYLLENYEKYAGLAGNWMLFGSSGHKTRPTGLQIENYTMSMPERMDMNRHVKLFVRPNKTGIMINPHTAEFHGDQLPVNTDFLPVDSPYSEPPVWNKLQINHYYYRSSQDFYEKLKRGMADSTREHHIPEKIVPPHGTVQDLRAALYAPIIRQLLAHSHMGSCAAVAGSRKKRGKL